MISTTLRAKVLLNILPNPKNKIEVIVERQNTQDIIREMLAAAKDYQSIYNLIPVDFFYDYKDLWKFTKQLFRYKEDSEKNQNLFSPVIMLEDAINNTGTIDCKNYSLFIAGVLQMWVNSGKKIDWYFKYVGYDNGDPSHVYVVADGIVLDCCEKNYNTESIYFNYICFNPFTKDMAINKISGKKIGDLGDPDEDPTPEDFTNLEYNAEGGYYTDPTTGQQYAQDGVTPIDVNEERGYYTEELTGKTYTLDGEEIIVNPDQGYYTVVETGLTFNDDGAQVILNPANGTYFEVETGKTYADDGEEIIIDYENGFYKEINTGATFTEDGTEVKIDDRNGFYREIDSGKSYTFDGTEVNINYDRGFYTEKDGSQYSFDGSPIIAYSNGTYKDLENGKIYNDDGKLATNQTPGTVANKKDSGTFGNGSTSIPSKANGDPTKDNKKTDPNGNNKAIPKTGYIPPKPDANNTDLLTPTNIAIGAGILLLLFFLSTNKK